MSQPHHETLKCAFCGYVFDVGSASDGPLLSDHPVSGGQGGNMAAQGLVTVVAEKGPETQPTSPDELPAYTCPRCGRLN